MDRGGGGKNKRSVLIPRSKSYIQRPWKKKPQIGLDAKGVLKKSRIPRQGLRLQADDIQTEGVDLDRGAEGQK